MQPWRDVILVAGESRGDARPARLGLERLALRPVADDRELDVGSIGEIVTGGVTGVMVRPEDAGAIRVAVEALLQDEAKRRALGSAAASRARERFGEQRMVERMIAAFEAARSGGA